MIETIRYNIFKKPFVLNQDYCLEETKLSFKLSKKKKSPGFEIIS